MSQPTDAVSDVYIPTLPEGAFVPMPQDAAELPGSPDDYLFPLFAIPVLGRLEREDAAGRVMVALAAHRRWAAVRFRPLMDNVFAEYRRYVAGESDVVDITVVTVGGPGAVIEGLKELIDAGLLGASDDNGDELIWVTPALLEKLARYNTRVYTVESELIPTNSPSQLAIIIATRALAHRLHKEFMGRLPVDTEFVVSTGFKTVEGGTIITASARRLG